MTKLEIDENTYDVIYCRDVIEHIPNPKVFLQTICKILKKGGILFIDTHNIDALVYKLTKEYHTVIFGFEHPLHWSPKTLTNACESVGLTHVDTHFQEIDLSLYRVLNYYNYPSFTYINPPTRSRIITKVMLFMQRLLSRKYIATLNNMLTKRIQKSTKFGSKMKVVFTK